MILFQIQFLATSWLRVVGIFCMALVCTTRSFDDRLCRKVSEIRKIFSTNSNRQLCVDSTFLLRIIMQLSTSFKSEVPVLYSQSVLSRWISCLCSSKFFFLHLFYFSLWQIDVNAELFDIRAGERMSLAIAR